MDAMSPSLYDQLCDAVTAVQHQVHAERNLPVEMFAVTDTCDRVRAAIAAIYEEGER
ncbi:MAG: hypothetical protein ACRDQG_14095 [Pseudonocardiaceae bacterium]